jgi:hypothetical protein
MNSVRAFNESLAVKQVRASRRTRACGAWLTGMSGDQSELLRLESEMKSEHERLHRLPAGDVRTPPQAHTHASSGRSRHSLSD